MARGSGPVTPQLQGCCRLLWRSPPELGLTTTVLLIKLLWGVTAPPGNEMLECPWSSLHRGSFSRSGWGPRAGCRHAGLEHGTPVTRRPPTECLDKEGGSCKWEKVFVLKPSELLLQGTNALRPSRAEGAFQGAFLRLTAKLPLPPLSQSSPRVAGPHQPPYPVRR